jgi:hypothetical protein
MATRAAPCPNDHRRQAGPDVAVGQRVTSSYDAGGNAPTTACSLCRAGKPAWSAAGRHSCGRPGGSAGTAGAGREGDTPPGRGEGQMSSHGADGEAFRPGLIWRHVAFPGLAARLAGVEPDFAKLAITASD